MNAEAYAIINQYRLDSHPEGGFYRETYRSDHLIETGDGRVRNLATAILFMVPKALTTAWHKVKSDEMWHFYKGASLELEIKDDFGHLKKVVLGSAIEEGEQLQYVVPAGVWQRARSLGNYTLVGCTVQPGFEFDDFEIKEGVPSTPNDLII